MRFLVKISIPVEAGNRVARSGFDIVPKILAEQKPEAAYFFAENGKRTIILILDMKEPSELPAIAEPWFLSLNASIEATPAMVAADIEKAGPAISDAVKKYGTGSWIADS